MNIELIVVGLIAVIAFITTIILDERLQTLRSDMSNLDNDTASVISLERSDTKLCQFQDEITDINEYLADLGHAIESSLKEFEALKVTIDKEFAKLLVDIDLHQKFSKQTVSKPKSKPVKKEKSKRGHK